MKACEESVTRLYDEQKAREAIKIIDQARLDLAQQLGEVESREAFILRKTTEHQAELLATTQERRDAYTTMLGQQYDMEASLRRQQELEKAISDQERIRAELQQQILYAQETGDTTGAAALQLQLEAVNTTLLTAIQRMREFWLATGGPEAQAALLALDGVEQRLKGTGKTAVVSGKEVNDAFAGTATSALDSFAQGLAETGDVFGSLRDAFLQFAADFLSAQLRAIAVGVGVPAHLVSGDLSQANYGSLRADMIAFKQRAEQIQYVVLAPQLLRPIYARAVTSLVFSGEIDAPDFETAARDWTRAEHLFPAPPWIDPAKDAAAEVALVEAGFKSRSQVIAGLGWSPDAVDAEIAADRAREKALGLSFGATAGAAPQPATEEPADNADA